MPSLNEGARTRAARPGIDHNGAAVLAGEVRVGQIQRTRLLAAMTEVAGEHGLADATVARVVARAGVSRRTFYELFEDREECFLAALDDAIARVSARVVPAYESGHGWAGQLRLALTALLSFLDVEPGAGRLLVVGSLGAGASALERRRRVLAQITTIVDAGHAEGGTAIALPPLTAEGVVGGALSVIHARMIEQQPRPLTELVGPLMSMIVMPYLGRAAARRELQRPASKLPPVRDAAPGDPLKALEMRLTYRTVRVLLAIGAHPGASNKEVGAASGAQDQGQISKLLARLEHLGLVHNDGAGEVRGQPNIWTLTRRGREVQGALTAESAQS
jgi:AcrR family transcriptional regulator/DNA-binding MarR family transcriptional regulator